MAVFELLYNELLLKRQKSLFWYSQKKRVPKIYLFRVNSRKRCEIRQRRRFGIFIVNFEHISCLFVLFLLLTLCKYLFDGDVLHWLFKTINHDVSVTSLDVFLLILNSYLVTRLFAIIEPHLGLLETIVIM